jgi:hypothetical protein
MEKYSEAGLVYGSELKGQWIKLQDQLPWFPFISKRVQGTAVVAYYVRQLCASSY